MPVVASFHITEYLISRHIQKLLYLAEFNGGYDFGTIISSDELELIYLQDGENGVAT
jgi:hypothetical protein